MSSLMTTHKQHVNEKETWLSKAFMKERDVKVENYSQVSISVKDGSSQGVTMT